MLIFIAEETRCFREARGGCASLFHTMYYSEWHFLFRHEDIDPFWNVESCLDAHALQTGSRGDQRVQDHAMRAVQVWVLTP